MNKKLLAAAVASAFAAPAFAQTSNVVLYGRLNLGIDNGSATGSYLNTATINHDFKDRTRVFDNGSRLGVRGTEDLGNGLRAIFQIESGVNANNGSSVAEANQYNASTGTLGSRPSWVGLEGNWGRVQFGRQDVWWSNGTINQTGANYVNNDLPWLTGGTGRVQAGISRQSNVVSYTSPTIAGLNATLSYSPDSNAAGQLNGSSQESAGQGKNTNARLWGITTRFAQGPFQAQYDFSYKQQASDFTAIPAGNTAPILPGMNAQPKWWNHKVGLAWMYVPGGQISFIGTYIRDTDIAIGEGTQNNIFQTLHQYTASLTWEQLIQGNILLLGQVGHMFNPSGCDGSAMTVNGIASNVADQVCHHGGATAYMAGVKYNFSKRTGAYLTFNHMTNQQNQFADYTGANYAIGSGGTVSCTSNTSCVPGTVGLPGTNGIPSTSKGAHISIIGLGLMHNF